MTTVTGPDTEPITRESGALDTGPQAVLELAEQGLTQRQLADRLGLSQATVSRRIREALAARRDQHRAIVHDVMMTYFVLLATIATAALATLAWH